MAGGKACPNSQVLSLFLKTPREGARRISTGKLFQWQGATAEKALFLVLSFWTSLSIRLLSLAGTSDWQNKKMHVFTWGRESLLRFIRLSLNCSDLYRPFNLRLPFVQYTIVLPSHIFLLSFQGRDISPLSSRNGRDMTPDLSLIHI